jgi:hypothetical protein
MTVANAHSGTDRRELARAAATRARIEHRNLLRARFARDEGSGRVSVRLESCSAPTLARVLARRKLSTRDAVRVLHDVASAVNALSRHGLIARDLTPRNIYLHPSRGAILADPGIPFELAPRRASEARRNLAYRSPEELEGGRVNACSSVYSLGAILYTTLTGLPPGSSPGRRASGAPVEPPRRLATVIQRAMASDPADRYADVSDLTLAAFAASRLEIASSADTRPRPQRPIAAPPPEPSPPRRPEPSPPRRPEPTARPQSDPEPAATPTAELKRPRREVKLPRPEVKLPQVKLPQVKLPQVNVSRPGLPRLPESPALPRPAVLATIGALVACALAGVLLGRSGGEQAQASQIGSRALTVRIPAGWESTEVPRDQAGALSAAVAAAPAGEKGAGLVVGRVSDTVALDRRFQDEMPPGSARTEIQLGRLQAWRYQKLALGPGLVATAYVAPTTGGALLILCQAQPQDAGARLPECERMAATIALRSARPLPLSEIDTRDEQLVSAMTSLGRDRRAGRRRLARAKLARGQAEVAGALQRAYVRSARRVEAIVAADSTTPYAELAGSLSATADAYGDLAAAAAKTDRSRYRAAIEAVRKREEAVRREAADPDAG